MIRANDIRIAAMVLRWYFGVAATATIVASAALGIMEVVRPYAVR